LISAATGIDVASARIHVAATGVHYITGIAAGLGLLLPEFLFFRFLDVFLACHQDHLPAFR
jgi:hypothetical protein